MKRQHKIAILKYIKGNLWLLLFPLIRGLFSIEGNFYNWLKNVYMDIIVIFILIGFAVLRWSTVQFKSTEKGIYVKKGAIFCSETLIPYGAISCITAYKFFLARPIKAIRILVDSESKGANEGQNQTDAELYVSEIDYSLIYNKIPDEKNLMKITYKASKRELVFFSMLFSSTLSGIIFIGTILIQGSRLAGRSLEAGLAEMVSGVTEAAEKILGRAVPVSVALTMLLAAGWLISFVKNLLRHMCFSLKRCGEKILVENGLLSKWKYYVNYSRLNYADLQQNLLMKMCRIMSLHVSCTGYGKSKNELPVLVPITSRKRLLSTMETMLPDFTQSNISIRPAAGCIGAYVWLPAAAVVLIPIVGAAAREIFPMWESVIKFLTLMGEVPSVYLLAVKISAKLGTGIGAEGANLTLKYCRLYRFHTVIVPKSRVAYIKIRRTLFQRAGGYCDLIIFTCGERVRGHRIKGVKYNEAEGLAQNYDKMC